MTESRSLTVDGYRCTAGAGLQDALGPGGSLEEAFRRVRDPAARIRRLRNRPFPIDLVRLGDGDSAPEAVVKAFPARSWRARADRAVRGSTRAERSWRAAEALVRHGILTPEPLLLMTPDDPNASGQSYYVARYLPGAIELRRLVNMLKWNAPDPEIASLAVDRTIRAVGRLARALHDAGIWHRDLTAGNLLLWPWPDPTPDLYLLDLDRTRLDRRIGRTIRIRELGRFPLFRDDYRRMLLEGYYGSDPVPALDAALYHLHNRAFHFRTRLRLKFRKSMARLPLVRSHPEQ